MDEPFLSMEKSIAQQVRDFLEQGKQTLIVLPSVPSTDAIASGLAFLLFLQKQGKKAKVVASDFQLPTNHAFLPNSKEIDSSLAQGEKLVITLRLANTKVDQLSYDVHGDALRVFITPKEGTLSPRDVSAASGGFEYGLIVTLDAPDLESLGELFERHSDFFYNTPIVNIDHRARNSNFGQVNLIDPTATSTSEVLFALLHELGDAFIDADIATNMLAGIISKTKSFQTLSVTPKSLSLASQLIARGARREEIIRHLYQTKSLGTLRLWGRILAGLKAEAQDRYVWSRLSQQDFAPTDEHLHQLASVIDELITDTPKAEITAIFYQDERGKAKAMVYTLPSIHAPALFRDFRPEHVKDLFALTFPTGRLDEAEQAVLRVVQEHYRRP